MCLISKKKEGCYVDDEEEGGFGEKGGINEKVGHLGQRGGFENWEIKQMQYPKFKGIFERPE